MDPDDNSMLFDFLREREETLDAIEAEILDLEHRADDTEALRALFRSVHSLKGTFGMLGFKDLEGVWQDAEVLLEAMRARSVRFTREIGDKLLASVDQTRTFFDRDDAHRRGESGQSQTPSQADQWLKR